MPWPGALSLRRLLHRLAATLPVGLGLTLAPAALVLAMLLLGRSDVTRDADKDALNIARATAQDIAGSLQLYDLSLRTAVRQMASPAVQALPPELRQALLFPGAAHDSKFGFIDALNEKGDVVADSTALTPRPGNFASRDYFRAQRANSADTLAIGRPFLTDPGQPTMIALSRRMVHPDQSFAGVVVGSMRIAYFAELFGRFSIGAHGTIALLRDDGMLLQRVPSVPGEIGHIPAASFNGMQPDTPAEAVDPIDHRLRRVVLHRVPDLPLLVAVGLAPEDIYAPWRSRAELILLSVAVLSGLSMLLLLSLRRASRKAADTGAKLRRQGMELVRLAGEQRDALARGQAAQERRAERLAQVSHDMRTLLQGIVGNVALLRQKGPLNDEQTQRLQALHDAGEHLRGMTELFLRSARLDDGTMSPHPTPTDIRALVARCCTMVSLVAERKAVQLTCESDPSLPDMVRTDETRLGIVLWNLLDNAVKFTHRGTVGLHASAQEGRLRFVIADTGCGMPPEAARRLQRPTASTAGKATGLCIARARTDELGGTIRCMKNPGGGSIVCLELPADAAVSAPATGSPRVPPVCVLLVDDSPISREPLAELLRSAGHAVTEAESGEQAVQLVATGAFDIALMDLRMPGIGGLEAVRCIRALPRHCARLPILLLTAGADDVDRTDCAALGLGEPLQKPCNEAMLLRAMAGALHDANNATGAASAGRTQQLELLSEELGQLLARLDAPAAADTAHLVAGDAGTLGFYGLADCCQRFEAVLRSGKDRTSCRSEVVRAVTNVLAKLPPA